MKIYLRTNFLTYKKLDRFHHKLEIGTIELVYGNGVTIWLYTDYGIATAVLK